MNPDGDTLLLGSNEETGLKAYTLGESGPVFSGYYQTPEFRQSGAAISADGEYVAAVSSKRFATFGPNSNAALRAYQPAAPAVPALRGAVWAGHVLITMTYDSSTGQPSVHSHGDAIAVPTSIYINAPYTGTVGGKAFMAGRLLARGNGVSGKQLTVTRTDGAGTVTVGHLTTGDGGDYTTTVDTPNGKYVTWKISFAGDNDFQPTSATTPPVYIIRAETFLSIATDKTAYYYNQAVRVTAHLGSTYSNRTVAIYAQPANATKRRIALGHVDGAGKLSANFRVTRDTVFSATFAGDLRRAPASTTLLRTTHAQVLGELNNYYGTDSEGYRLYHKSQNAKLHGHVDPNKAGQCAYFGLEHYVDGKWKSFAGSGCFRLNAYSNSDVYWLLSNFAVIGRKYRTGMYWGGDRVNSSYGSLYRYFKVTA